MKKKLICTAIIVTMVTSLTACGSNADSNVMSDDGNMTESAEIATDDEAEKATTETASALSANNKNDASDSTNKPATNNNTSSTNDSKKNTSTESTAPATETPRQDSQTTTEAPVHENPATTEAPTAPATEPEKECPRSSTGKHKWYDHYKTITVVDQEAYDEKTPTGEYQTKLEKHMYASAYATNPETGMSNYVCDIDVTGMNVADARAYLKSMGYEMGNTWSDYVTVTDYNNPIYKTVYHDAVTHTERVLDYTDCSVCGAKKQ